MITPSARRKVYERDGWRCWYCGKHLTQSSAPDDENTPCLDHIIAKSRYGDNCQSNLRLSCKSCNAAKADLDEEEYRWSLTLKESEAARQYHQFDQLVFELESNCESHYYEDVSPMINEVREMRDALLGQFTMHRFFGEERCSVGPTSTVITMDHFPWATS